MRSHPEIGIWKLVSGTPCFGPHCILRGQNPLTAQYLGPNTSSLAVRVHDMCNAGYINPRPKGCRSHDVWALTLDSSLETNFSLSKKVGITILGILIIVVASQLLGQHLTLSITSVVDHALLSRYQTPKPSINQLPGLYRPSPITDPEHGILDINIVARRADIKGIL